MRAVAGLLGWILLGAASPVAAGAARPPEWQAALLEETLRTLGGSAPEAAPAVAGELLDLELRLGLPDEALATLGSLPPATRSRVLSGPLPARKVDLAGSPLEIPARDLRLDLAIAFALAGDSGRAAGIEKTLAPLEPAPARTWMDPSPAPVPFRIPRDLDWRVRRVLDRWLRPNPGDPFELLGDSLVSLPLAWKTDRLLLLARLADREGYPGMAAYAERYAVLGMRWTSGPFEGVPGQPPRVSATARRLAAARESLRQGFRIVKSARPIPPLPADARRDSDGDGLTDLEERRLFTDPGDPDTDHDGLPDGNDPLPGVPFDGSAAARSRADALAAALREITGRDPRAYAAGESPVQRETEYLVCDPGVFAGLQPVRRAVVLTPQEADAAKEKLGIEVPLWLGVFFDRSGKRAQVIWSIPHQGGVLRLEEASGWKIEVFGDWIS